MSSALSIALPCVGLICACRPTHSSVSLTLSRDPYQLEYVDGADFSNLEGKFSVLDPSSIELAGAPNETVSFCFALGVRDSSLRSPNLEVAPLVADGDTIGPSAVHLFRIHQTPVENWPGWHIRSFPPHLRNHLPWDVLVPLDAPRGGLPKLLVQGEPYLFWVDIAIPRLAASGVYNGSIKLTSQDGDARTMAIQLMVHPFTLREQAGVTMLAELDHIKLFRAHVRCQGRPYAPATDDWRHDPVSQRLDDVLAETMRMLRRHHLTPVLPDLSPIVRVAPNGRLIVQWEAYDEIVAPCLDGTTFDGGLPSRYWPLPVPFGMSERGVGVVPGASASPNRRRRFFAACARHFASNRWLVRSYASPPSADGEISQAFQRFKRFANEIRLADSRIPIVAKLPPQDIGPFGWYGYAYEDVSDLVDIWMPKAQFFDGPIMADLRRRGFQTWVQMDRPPFSGTTSISAPATSVRALTWQAAALGADVVNLGSVNNWPANIDGALPEDCVRHDPTVLIYPGTSFGLDHPIPSVRLKRLRQGMDDARYAALLKDRGAEHVSEALRGSLTPYCGTAAYRNHYADGLESGTATRPEWFGMARTILAEALAASSSGASRRSVSRGFSQSVGWRSFMEASRRVSVRSNGVRIYADTPSTNRSARVDGSVTVRNATRLPVRGTMHFGLMQDGWQPITLDSALAIIEPSKSLTRTVSSRVEALPFNASGVFTAPVELRTIDGVVYEGQSRVACIEARPQASRLSMDGDLSDWSAGTSNVASDFVLINPGATGTEAGRRNRPQHATTVLVTSDSTSLFIAINCQTGMEPTRPVARRSGVRFDDMIPCGEDLVEILFDPLNAGTRSPEDLYYLAIKRSGPYFAALGVPLDPPCGASTSWRIVPEYASDDRSAGRWTIELRIPFAAFTGAVTERTVWGFNVARHDAVHREYSTWSGAVSTAYDPLSLGNLVLP